MDKPTPRALIALLAGLIIFCGIPLLGWGLGALGGFFDEPARLAFIVVAAVAQAIIAMRLPDAGHNRVDTQEDMGAHIWSLRAMQVLPTLMLLVGPFCDRRDILSMGQATAARWLGVALFAAGFAIMHIAEVALDKSFTVQVAIMEDHKLVTTGPYARIRHPRYLGIALFALGIALSFAAWLSVALTLLVIAALVWRCVDEDAMLREAFGVEWEAWAARSWRLIPWVW